MCVCFPGPSAFSDWLYCVNYTTVAAVDMQSNCTHDLEIHLSSLDNDTVYRFIVSAIGPGGERATPNEFLFRTKPAGKYIRPGLPTKQKECSIIYVSLLY